MILGLQWGAFVFSLSKSSSILHFVPRLSSGFAFDRHPNKVRARTGSMSPPFDLVPDAASDPVFSSIGVPFRATPPHTRNVDHTLMHDLIDFHGSLSGLMLICSIRMRIELSI